MTTSLDRLNSILEYKGTLETCMGSQSQPSSSRNLRAYALMVSARFPDLASVEGESVTLTHDIQTTVNQVALRLFEQRDIKSPLALITQEHLPHNRFFN